MERSSPGRPDRPGHIVLVDNHDSYTFNLAALLTSAGAEVSVVRNDDPSLLSVEGVDGIVLSPGPGSPWVASDVGYGPALLARLPDVPVLGVCLGHQLLATLHGGEVARVEPAHGKIASIRYEEPAGSTSLLAGLPQGFAATRYHSLAVTSGPGCGFDETAWAEDGTVMALAVRDRPRWGVQFHPESVETELGSRIIAAFVEVVRGTAVLRTSIPGSFDPGVLFEALHAADPYAFWLDGPTTYLGAGVPTDRATLSGPRLRDPLPGGLVGCREYEGAERWLFVERVIALTPAGAELRVLPGEGAEEWLQASAATLELLRGVTADVEVTPVEPAVPRAARTREAYLGDIAACKELLAGGESYELCLTNRLHLPPLEDPLALHRQLRARTPTARSAFLRLDGTAICSATPETFLTVSPSGTVTARPIKGTAARHADPARDAQAAAALVTDPKTRAENLMIVDLLRNDLNQVCEPGSVAVPGYLEVESYATVHQLVSTVTGRLRPDATPLDAVRAAFPPGSMTGAPKERTVALLAELEPEPRGIYSGALGVVGADGSVDLSVVIRTAVCTPEGVTIGTGGAIVWDSVPADEYDETMLKARALLEAYAATL
ncbi:MAG: chorismate-binding protein [Nocardioides sp.]